MIGFLIRKMAYDSWDNLLRLAAVNVGFVASMAIPILLPGVIKITAVSIAVMVIGILWCFVYLATTALSVKTVSDYGSFGFRDFLNNLKAVWPFGLFMALIVAILVTMVVYIIPFYLSMGSMLGLFLAAVIFWTVIVCIASLQFFFAIRSRLDTKLIKVLKKCFIIFFDNPGFSIFCLLYNLFNLALSCVFFLMFPGPSGMLLFLDEALRLRLMKYDWLEANPATEPSRKRRKIPWDAILIDEREKTGTRTFKNFIFPWKD